MDNPIILFPCGCGCTPTVRHLSSCSLYWIECPGCKIMTPVGRDLDAVTAVWNSQYLLKEAHKKAGGENSAGTDP